MREFPRAATRHDVAGSKACQPLPRRRSMPTQGWGGAAEEHAVADRSDRAPLSMRAIAKNCRAQPTGNRRHHSATATGRATRVQLEVPPFMPLLLLAEHPHASTLCGSGNSTSVPLLQPMNFIAKSVRFKARQSKKSGTHNLSSHPPTNTRIVVCATCSANGESRWAPSPTSPSPCRRRCAMRANNLVGETSAAAFLESIAPSPQTCRPTVGASERTP